jgi:hypothetical protein
MRNRISGKLLFSLGFVLLFAFLIYVSMGYNQLARLVPIVVLVPGLGFALIQFILDLRAALRSEKPASAETHTTAAEATAADKPKEEKKEKLSPQEKRRRELVGIGWLLAFFVMIVLFGLIPAIPLFVLVFMRFFGGESWRLSVGFAVVCWAFVYGVFVWGLRNEMYPGILLPMIVK